MNITGARVLLLGGSGLVGLAIARALLPHRPASVVISALTEGEAHGAIAELASEAGSAELVPEWGDIFLPETLRTRRRAELLSDPQARSELLDDLYGLAAEDAVERSALGALLLRHRPELVVDCINTATVLAYQNVFRGAQDLLRAARSGPVEGGAVEGLLATLYLPQLIRHVQVAREAMQRAGTQLYLKIGTAGSGGMGLNIPFTHSEERPSKVLLAKSSLAGAHTLLLYLMARTPGGPAVKEIKPTAAISWKRIGFGDVSRAGRPVRRVDALEALPLTAAFVEGVGERGAWRDTGEPLRGVFLDAGENGLFSPPEFETLTALGLMEFITPEEIARDVVREVRGEPTGRDVVGALDASTSGPTYRAGVLRQFALDRMTQLERENGVRSVAYEMLGPPRLTKLLFEAELLRRVGPNLYTVTRMDSSAIAGEAEQVIHEDGELRCQIVSAGIPILMADGARLLRGPVAHIVPDREQAPYPVARDNGWVDLRPENWSRWQDRARAMLAGAPGAHAADSGSRFDLELWHLNGEIRPGEMAAWVFRHEDAGERVKR